MKFDGRIAVFGGRFITDEIYNDTVEIGKRMAQKNWLVFCGGGEGVMEAIAKGVALGGGTCIGILKDKDFKTGIIPFLSSNLHIVKSDTDLNFSLNFTFLSKGTSTE